MTQTGSSVYVLIRDSYPPRSTATSTASTWPIMRVGKHRRISLPCLQIPELKRT
jgi:hypothetical protein